jgi:phosphocarrier protein HPr
VELSKDEHHVDAKSIMGVLLLCGTPGSTITVSAWGVDAQAAVDALVALVSDRFGEAE